MAFAVGAFATAAGAGVAIAIRVFATAEFQLPWRVGEFGWRCKLAWEFQREPEFGLQFFWEPEQQFVVDTGPLPVVIAFIAQRPEVEREEKEAQRFALCLFF